MRIALFFLLALTLFTTSCTQTHRLLKSQVGKIDYNSPVSVVEAIFYAAKSKNFSQLSTLCHPDKEKGDGDVRDVCGVASADKDFQKEFIEHFVKSKIDGKPRISGDRAEVDFWFGPDGKKYETMNLRRENGRWYLASF